jgi:hypothetical protein
VTLKELIARVRVLANDQIKPYFWSDEEITAWLNEAVDEAAIRGRLLYEKQDSYCKTSVVQGEDTYPLPPALYEIVHLSFQPEKQERRVPLRLISHEDMDAVRPGWREHFGLPVFALQGERTIRLAPTPNCGGLLHIEGYRLSVRKMRLNHGDEDTPEIHPASHIHLAQWALHKGFSVPDADAFDPERSALAEQEFTRYFGWRPDSNLRRITREDVPHHVQAFWV